MSWPDARRDVPGNTGSVGERPGVRLDWRLVLLLLVTLAVHAPTLGNGFVFDDRMVAVGVREGGLPNPRIATLQPLWVYCSTHYWADSTMRSAG